MWGIPCAILACTLKIGLRRMQTMPKLCCFAALVRNTSQYDGTAARSHTHSVGINTVYEARLERVEVPCFKARATHTHSRCTKIGTGTRIGFVKSGNEAHNFFGTPAPVGETVQVGCESGPIGRCAFVLGQEFKSFSCG